jgi:methylenetetrahydrofolate dehydrogenase (NADP+)/methenyltetrahydrofolate cyclohydrolase
MILDGKKTAKLRNEILKNKIVEDTKQYRAPHLAIILVGSHPASLSYIKGKLKAAESIGMKATLHHYEEDVASDEIYQKIIALNHDQDVDGMILQLPLPKHLDEEMLTRAIDVTKDADGFHVLNQGLMYQGKANIKPATPYGMTLLLEAYNIDVKGKHAVIVGRSNIVGFPIARLLMDMGATITVCHSKTKDLAYHTKQADILVVSVGKKHLIDASMIKEGVVILDVGINKVDQKLYGDVNYEDVYEKAKAITPVPGGVGPMTIHALLLNTYHLYENHVKIMHK